MGTVLFQVVAMDYALSAAVVILLFEIGFWALRFKELLQTALWVPTILPGVLPDSHEDLPRVSVIVPARNEEVLIRECLQSVLDQDYPSYEVILVDDRSHDRTVAIAEELGRGRSNFQVIRVRELAEGWTGKSHALDVGVRHASGEWLAFLDADSTLEKSALRQCYGAAVQHRVNMITLSPKFLLETLWEKALQPTFISMSCILFPLPRINDPESPVASANGMFFLINRYAYDKIGGHRGVKGLAVEDIGIGKRVKASGLGLLFANGRYVLQTRMYTGLKEILDGWTRILSGSMDYEISTALKYLFMHLLMSPLAGIFSVYTFISAGMGLFPSTWYILPAILALQAIVIPACYCSQLDIPNRYAGLMFIGNFFLIWVFFIIIKKILMKDALQWRGTIYRTSLYSPGALNPLRPSQGE
ncbi:MAG: glycosyltransferase [Syntrophales bacterium]|nr:glycosyltransferase [Syntrophales bacterium]